MRAAQAGQQLVRNPLAGQGMNGTSPDIIPAIRPADTMAGGTALCAVCFVPQRQTSLLAATPGWAPGRPA